MYAAAYSAFIVDLRGNEYSATFTNLDSKKVKLVSTRRRIALKETTRQTIVDQAYVQHEPPGWRRGVVVSGVRQ